VSGRVAEGLVGICADCPLVIVPALPLSLGVETPVLPLVLGALLRAESVSALCERLESAAVVLLSAKLGADAAMSRATVANVIESFIMRCSLRIEA
jgi:hypothetical protein